MKSPQLIRNLIILIIVLIVICGGTIAVYRVFAVANNSTPLPDVPTYEYFTPALVTPLSTNATAPTLNAPSTPIPTAQPFSLLSLFNETQTATPTSTATLQSSGVVFYTATKTPQILNIIIPTQTRQPIQTAQLPPIQPQPANVDCKNILYPMVPGQSWTYAVTAGSHSANILMTIVSVGGSQGVVNVINQSTGTNKQTVAICDKDTILSFPGLSTEFLLSSALNGNMQANYVSGVLAPNEAAFIANNWAMSWSTQYLISGNSMINFRGSNLNVTVSPSNMTVSCQTLASGNAAFENITVSAGTFYTLKVVCRGQGQVTGIVDGSSIVGQISAQSTQWFSPHLGMVKMRSDFANLNLFGVTIPLDATGINEQVELKSFTQAP